MEVAVFRPFAMVTTLAVAWLGGAAVFLRVPHSHAHDHGAPGQEAVDLSHINMFAGGIFLAGGYVHLLPEAVATEALTQWGDPPGGDAPFPWPYLFCAIGFLAVLLVEELAKYWQHLFWGLHSVFLPEGAREAEAEAAPLLLLRSPSHRHDHRRRRPGSLPGSIGCDEGQDGCVPVEEDCMGDIQCVRTPAHDNRHTDAAIASNLVVAVVLTAALTFHSLMEGLGLGASNTANWGVYAAIIAHKGLAAFSLSSRFASVGASRGRTLGLVLFFGCMTPLGIAFGWLAARTSSAARPSAAAGICLALSAGTFIYIATIEIIPKELANPDHKLQKILSLLAGFASFATLATWT